LSYDGIDIEAELAGTLVIIRNQDVPGVIGRIGTILGEARLNIANFALGRSRGGRVPEGHALAVVQLDTVPGDGRALAGAIEQLQKVEAITSVRVVELGRL
jgi:D-3-phosphoglycerate dehydrogenase